MSSIPFLPLGIDISKATFDVALLNEGHRAKRAKAVSLTPLDDIPGVGAARKKALLLHFGSAKAVARAGLSDLAAVDGITGPGLF